MCTGRVDMAFILRAFQGRADGVIIGGCWPGECHYVTEGNYDALGNVLLGKALLRQLGLRPDRLRIAWIAASEGTRFAEIMTEFVGQVAKLGPLGRGEGLDEEVLGRRLDAACQLVPYLKLVEREKLRVPTRSEEAYNAFFQNEDVGDLFASLVGDKLASGQILSILAQGSLPTGDIAERLGLSPQEASRHLISSTRQGLVRYDVNNKRYALA